MLGWITLVIAAAVLLMIGIERILRRLNIQRGRPDDQPGGIRDLLGRIEQWQQDHASRRR